MKKTEKKIEEIEFFMSMIPPTVTAQEHKVNTRGKVPRFYDPFALANAREDLMGHLYLYKPKRGFEGFECGVRLTVKWLFPIPNGSKHYNGEYRITKPDTDNLNKLLKDCMTRVGYWKDDALVCSEICEKFWAEKPGIYIRIEVIA